MIRWLQSLFGLGRKDQTHTAPDENVAVPGLVKKATRKKARPASTQRVLLGFDFGTHSTKIVLREGPSETGEVFLLEDPQTDETIYDERSGWPYPWFGTPSLVGIDDGKLWFGGRARGIPFERRFVALKACLHIGEDGPVALPREKVDLLGLGESTDAVEFLITSYFSWAMIQVREQLDERYGRGAYVPILQIGAPMTRKGDADMEGRYRKCLWVAWRISLLEEGAIGQGMPLAEVREIVEPRLGTPEPQESGEVPFDVLPETLAELTAVSEDPRFSNDLYTVIDVGGGTTEITLADLRGTGARKLQLYDDWTGAGGGWHLRQEERQQEKNQLIEKIAKKQQVIWAHQFKHIANQTRDIKESPIRRAFFSNVVLRSGGGWFSEELLSRIERNNPAAQYRERHEKYHKYEVHKFEPTRDRLSEGEGKHHPTETPRDDFSLLATALGLSIPHQQWPQQFSPTDNLRPPPPPRPIPPADPFHGHN